jgi:hypothetical protein
MAVILCTCVWKWKTCWNYSKKEGEGIKESDGGMNVRYIVSIFVNVTMYPQYNNKTLIKNFKWIRRSWNRKLLDFILTLRLHDFTLQRAHIHFLWSPNLGQIDTDLLKWCGGSVGGVF